MTIGLAMNSVYYYQKRKMERLIAKNLMIRKLKNKVNKWLPEILTRLRANDDLKDIPIHFAIYKQSDQNSITPGEFIANTTVDDDQTKINKWKKLIKCQHYYHLQQQKIQ